MQMPPNPAQRHVHADTAVRNEMVGIDQNGGTIPVPLKRSDLGNGHEDIQTASDLLKLFMAMQFDSGGWLDGLSPTIAGSKLSK